MTALPKRKYTLEEYIELLKSSDERYEYFDGEVVAMGGGKIAHGAIAANLIYGLRSKLTDRSCQIFGGDVALKVPRAWPFRFPDVSVVCGEPVIEEIQGIEMLVNPVLIIEVLSPSTAAYDLGEKFTAYQSIETFQEYLLISQERPHVIQHLRQAKRRWLRIEIEGLDSEVALESVNATLTLSEIYERVNFQTEEPQP
jgi:Uma2 family endonuclease